MSLPFPAGGPNLRPGDFFAAAVEDLRARGLLRQPRLVSGTGPHAIVDGRRALLLCSNNYLGLAGAPEIARAASAAALELGAGAGASRLISGDTPLHRQAEARLATFVGLPAALFLPSGYHANIGLLPAIAGAGDLIVSDSLNHASIVDGCRLSRADVLVTPHGDVTAVREALRRRRPASRAFVVTEALFSMDGDLAPLQDLRAVCDEQRAALVVDEAHALGVLGPAGAGGCAAAGIVPDALVGTLGKALGAAGAFIAGATVLRDLLVTACRSFVFTTAAPPPILAAAIAAADLAATADDRRKKLHDLESVARQILGRRVAPSAGPILPVVVGDPDATMRLSAALLERGFFVHGIRPPTVPDGTCRLRLTLMATHDPAEVAAAAEAIAELLP